MSGGTTSGNDRLRVGVIGLGYWGPNYARVLSELPAADLVAACDLSEDAISPLAARYPAARMGRDPRTILEADDVDAVVVATPTSTHYALTRAALDAGKHVLCEKPLASTVAQCDELIAAAKRARRVLFVGHTFIFNPAVRQMRELVAAGELGRVLYCHTVRTALGPIRQDVNALWDLAPHDLSILFYLLEREPVSVTATGQAFLRNGFEDVAFLQLRFEDETLAGAHLSWLDPYKVRRVTVVGDERMVVFDDVAIDEKLKVFDRGMEREPYYDDFGQWQVAYRYGESHSVPLNFQEPLRLQAEEFCRAIKTGDEPLTSGADGLAVVRTLEAATATMRLGAVPTLRGPE